MDHPMLIERPPTCILIAWISGLWTASNLNSFFFNTDNDLWVFWQLSLVNQVHIRTPYWIDRQSCNWLTCHANVTKIKWTTLNPFHMFISPRGKGIWYFLNNVKLVASYKLCWTTAWCFMWTEEQGNGDFFYHPIFLSIKSSWGLWIWFFMNEDVAFQSRYTKRKYMNEFVPNGYGNMEF